MFIYTIQSFQRIIEKLQTKLEETKDSEKAVTDVLVCLRAWLEKQGVKQDQQEEEQVLEKELQESGRRLARCDATPCKAGRLGRPATKLLTCLVDYLAVLHPGAEEEDSIGKTPARQAQLVKFLKTPQVEVVLDPEDEVDNMVANEASLGERLAAAAGSGALSTPVARKPAYPRFKSVVDFTEGSPALAGRLLLFPTSVFHK